MPVHSMPGREPEGRHPFWKASQATVEMGRKLLEGCGHRKDSIGLKRINLLCGE